MAVRSHPYRLHNLHKLKVMLEMGLIDESHSGWSSPIVLVYKSDGSIKQTQEVEGVDPPVLYLSYKLMDREVRYSTVKKECVAIK